ncbi:glycosyl hydrolase family 18 protein [Alicyclobacillus dauci]|uniref:Glycosyl hydrolase family 18 protein n=1 Tax=Alicyclobacillus dauci TaxID=1475485 RepID=A0ABY6Z700_9BACL|nr:glycosyl hydrolase family 18 protein [Alicyclobacillus dauci]WAH38656.1 glycosyl hydrolase family 18 protein [Alicyclobacillus dauci]
MFIHTVVSGDTLGDIARIYGTTTRELDHLNELATLDVLVPGLHLLVPGRTRNVAQPYRIQPGDSVASIAQRIGISETNLERWLGFRGTIGTDLTAGTTIWVPKPVPQKRTIEVNSYLLPSGKVHDVEIIQGISNLTYLCIFSYQATTDGGLQIIPDQQAVRAAAQYNITPLMSVTNGPGFRPELAHTLITNVSLREQFIRNIVNTAKQRGFRGVNVDFEHMNPGDRQPYNQFIHDLGNAVHAQGLSISIAMGPKTSDAPQQPWMGAFDYKTLGAEVDFLMLMTYEWGWVGGPPMAIAPINQVRAVLEYATSVIPSNKILMGIPLYGYDWELPHQPGGLASGLSANDAQNLALERQVPILWDNESASPYFLYDVDNKRHIVWFEDAMSVAAKFNLIFDFDLRGISYWVLPNSFPQNWNLLNDVFEIRKLASASESPFNS